MCIRDSFKGKPLAEQVIEKAFGLGPSFWPAAKSDAFLKRPVEQLFFRSLRKYLVQRISSNRAIDLLSVQTQFQTSPANRLLSHLRRCITERVAFVIEIAILTQQVNHSFNDGLTGSP